MTENIKQAAEEKARAIANTSYPPETLQWHHCYHDALANELKNQLPKQEEVSQPKLINLTISEVIEKSLKEGKIPLVTFEDTLPQMIKEGQTWYAQSYVDDLHKAISECFEKIEALEAAKQEEPTPQDNDKHWYEIKELMISCMENKRATPEDWVNICKGLGYSLTRLSKGQSVQECDATEGDSNSNAGEQENKKPVEEEPTQRLRWVKASERLPENGKLVYLKLSGVLMLVGQYFKENAQHPAYFRDASYMGQDERYNYGGRLPSHQPPFPNVEWLEEIQEPQQPLK
jgi:hypothetical protein